MKPFTFRCRKVRRLLCSTEKARNRSSLTANESSNGGAAVENATLAKLNLTSDAFQNGQPIAAQFTCDEVNQAPALSWGEPPPGTKSFALVVDDPDAPSGIFHHWGVFD